MTIQDIKDVELELKRFSKKLKEVKERYKTDRNYMFFGCKETGAIKRAAIDLKNELTKLNK